MSKKQEASIQVTPEFMNNTYDEVVKIYGRTPSPEEFLEFSKSEKAEELVDDFKTSIAEKNIKHIVCFSGGHSSGLVAIEVVRKFGKENVILLNHNINPDIELPDVKRFKQEIADYLGIPITYANHERWETITPIQVCVEKKTWVNVTNRSILCTYDLKTKPFYDWLDENYNEGDICYYGFDADEQTRITRRSLMMGGAGYKTDYPLALWDRTIQSSEEIGVSKPQQYDKFNHANCMGCLKAGWQHWYIIYCDYPHIWEEAKAGEESIGFSVHKGAYFEDKEEQFELMKELGIEPTEKIQSQTWWAMVRKKIKEHNRQAESGEYQVSLFDIPLSENSVECTGDCKL